MKLLRLLSPGVPALFMSPGVTAGAMYVTISAAPSSDIALPDSEVATATTTVVSSQQPVSWKIRPFDSPVTVA